MATWKILPVESEALAVNYTSFLNGRKFFAVDDSGSAAGSIIKQECAFVKAINDEFPNSGDTVSLWGTNCDVPTSDFGYLNQRSCHGGTDPTRILEGSALDAIRKSDVWFLLTDGQIPGYLVHRLAEMALCLDILNVPLVFLITGYCGQSPGQADISVGISFFASSQDTLILFKQADTGTIFVIAGKGCFAGLGGSAAAQDLTDWSKLRSFDSEEAFYGFCEMLDIKVPTSETRASYPTGISLGSEWERKHNGPVQVDIDLLLTSGTLSDEELSDVLAEEAFDILAVACKTRRRIPDLRAFLRNQKIEQVAPKLEDVSGAAAILSRLGDLEVTAEQRKLLQEKLREAHSRNREHYHNAMVGSLEDQRTRERNKLVDAALASLASVEAMGFHAEILGRRSNRAMRAEVVSSGVASDVSIIDFEAPAFKGFCLVCCGEDEIMSICLKPLDPECVSDNTSDFALNFPLAAGAFGKNVDLVSSQNICFQCAQLNPSGRSVYNEPVVAIIPTVQYDGSNKSYINNQLYLALTAQLATGAAGIAQLFMAILQEVLRTKAWAIASPDSAQASPDQVDEIIQRQETFEWMLKELIRNTRTRRTFNETGDWVRFPEALAWAAKDFETNTLASFAVTYPAAGFDNLVALGVATEVFSEAIVHQLRVAKMLHSITSKYLADLQQNFHAPKAWKQKYLETIYRDFNGPLVPRDQGSASLITDPEIFAQRLQACLNQTSFLFSTLPATEQATLMPKIQILLFWLVFKQKHHCTTQTFFTKTRELTPLAHAILSPTLPVPAHDHSKILLSLFVTEDSQPINPTAAAAHECVIPFATPFGASVLHCSAPTCRTPFSTLTSVDEITPQTLHAIRAARTQHLVSVFGVSGRFETSQTGLPDRSDVHSGAPPSSLHSNMHVTIAREWAKLDVEARRGIVADAKACDEFVSAVCGQLCTSGRGDIFSAGLRRHVSGLMPSFFEVLALALKVEGFDARDIAVYELDLKKNRVEDKVRWEMRAMGI